MTENLPPQMQAGAADGPNPLEVFYEKNKKWLWGLGVILAVAFVANYGIRKFQDAARDKAWRGFTASTGLAAEFGSKVDLQPLRPGLNQQQQQRESIWWQIKINQRVREIVGKLMEDVQQIDAAMLARAKGTAQEPWLLWVAANHAFAQEEWDTAKNHCEDLKARFANHFLCRETPYPPQVRKEKKKDKKKKKGDEETEDPDAKPEFEDPVPGSLVNNLLASIATNQAFHGKHAEFFAAPEPDRSETAVFKFEGGREVEIAFYPSAEKHVAAFKKNVAEKYYHDMRIHQLTLPGEQADGKGARSLHLGHPASKKDDRAKWREPVEAKDEDILEFEVDDALSFFPFVVAAEEEKDGKSSARRFFIVTNDCAATHDGSYVILGRVIRGQDKLEEVMVGGMLDENDKRVGKGPPAQALKVESTELRKAGK